LTVLVLVGLGSSSLVKVDFGLLDEAVVDDLIVRFAAGFPPAADGAVVVFNCALVCTILFDFW
jgi:hypothetical protein